MANNRIIKSLVVVGSGPWAQRHMEIIHKSGNLHLAGIVSKSLFQHRRIFLNKFDHLNVWPGIANMLSANIRLDGIVIATDPSFIHKNLQILITKKVPLLIEKPLGLSYSEAKYILAQAQLTNTLIMVNFIHLFGTGYKLLCSHLNKIGNIIDLRTIGGNYGPFRSYMSALWDYGPHEIAFALALIGDYPSRITAELIKGDKQRHIILAKMAFPNGAKAELEFGNLMEHKKRTLMCITENGSVKLTDYPSPSLIINGKSQCVLGPSPLENVLSSFSKNIESGSDKLETAQIALNVNRCINEIEAYLW